MAALLRAVSRLPGPAPRTRLCWRGPRRWAGSRPQPPPAKPPPAKPPLTKPPPAKPPPAQPPEPEERFHMIYRFPAIRAVGLCSRLKLAQTAATLLALPTGLYGYSQGLLPLSSLHLAGGVAAFALGMLYWMSAFSRRLVGILYLSESGRTLRVAHLTFWGRRRDSYWPADEVVPMSETGELPRDLFVRIQRCGGRETFFLTLRYGRLLDRERFEQVFGRLGRLK